MSGSSVQRSQHAIEMEMLDCLNRHIESDKFPCVGGKSILQSQQFNFCTYDLLDATSTAYSLHNHLGQFRSKWKLDDHKESRSINFFSYIAGFSGQQFETELQAVNSFFSLLRNLHDIDTANNIAWDKDSASPLTSPNFSFSIGGFSYFLIFMHKYAYNQARRTELTFVVFNPHYIFLNLRLRGVFEKFRDRIRRNLHEAGLEINAELQDYGIESEFRQYVLASPELQNEINSLTENIFAGTILLGDVKDRTI